MINVQSTPGRVETVPAVTPPLFLGSTDRAPWHARQFVAKWFSLWGFSDDYLMRLVVSELVTNAHQHGKGDVIIVRMYLDERDGAPVVEVWNEGDGVPLVRPENYAATDGRGMLTVEALALEWGVRKPCEGGTVAWARLLD
ncbi:ATP-binding protein [Spirillospora sp. CA-255316]